MNEQRNSSSSHVDQQVIHKQLAIPVCLFIIAQMFFVPEAGLIGSIFAGLTGAAPFLLRLFRQDLGGAIALTIAVTALSPLYGMLVRFGLDLVNAYNPWI